MQRYLIGLVLVITVAHAEETRGLRPLVVTDSQAQPVTEFRAHHALVVGNSRYSAGWPELPGVRDDVVAVQETLERHGFQVTVGTDLTKAQMIETFDAFISDHCQDESGRGVVYYAGHGQTLNGVGYLVPVDAPLSDDRGFIKKALPISSLKTSAMQARSRHMLFAFDACFAGSIFVPLRGANTYVLRAAAEPVRMFLTAGSANEQVPDKSYFRYEFIAGINGKADANSDGYVTGSELGTYIKQAVSDRAAAAGMKLSPQAGVSEQEGLNRGDFVFQVAPLAEPGPAAVPTSKAPAMSAPIAVAAPSPVGGTPASVGMPSVDGLPPSTTAANGVVVDGLPPSMVPTTRTREVPILASDDTALWNTYDGLAGTYEVPRRLDPRRDYKSFSFYIDKEKKKFIGANIKPMLLIYNDGVRVRGANVILRMVVERLAADGRALLVTGTNFDDRLVTVRLEPMPDGDLRWSIGDAQYTLSKVSSTR